MLVGNGSSIHCSDSRWASIVSGGSCSQAGGGPSSSMVAGEVRAVNRKHALLIGAKAIRGNLNKPIRSLRGLSLVVLEFLWSSRSYLKAAEWFLGFCNLVFHWLGNHTLTRKWSFIGSFAIQVTLRDHLIEDLRNFAAGGGHCLLWPEVTAFLSHISQFAARGRQGYRTGSGQEKRTIAAVYEARSSCN